MPDSCVLVFNVGVLVRSQHVPAIFFFFFFGRGLSSSSAMCLKVCLWNTSAVRAGDFQRGVKGRNLFKEMSEKLKVIISV